MGQHLQEDLLLGQKRQILKDKSRQGSASRPKSTASPPPASEPHYPARARTRVPRELEPRAPGTRPAAPWTGDCPSLPSLRCAHSSANSPRDSGNFLTSVLGAASPPRSHSNRCRASAPGPAPAYSALAPLARFSQPAPGSPRAQASWRQGPGRSRTRRGGAQAAWPRLQRGVASRAARTWCRLRLRRGTPRSSLCSRMRLLVES